MSSYRLCNWINLIAFRKCLFFGAITYKFHHPQLDNGGDGCYGYNLIICSVILIGIAYLKLLFLKVIGHILSRCECDFFWWWITVFSSWESNLEPPTSSLQPLPFWLKPQVPIFPFYDIWHAPEQPSRLPNLPCSLCLWF